MDVSRTARFYLRVAHTSPSLRCTRHPIPSGRRIRQVLQRPPKRGSTTSEELQQTSDPGKDIRAEYMKEIHISSAYSLWV